MSKLVLSKLALFVLHYGICGSFHNKSTINASPLLWQNLDEDSFDMLYKNYCWEQPSLTQYERPMYHNERKINMLSSTDNNFMICIDLVLKLGFVCFFNSHCIFQTIGNTNFITVYNHCLSIPAHDYHECKLCVFVHGVCVLGCMHVCLWGWGGGVVHGILEYSLDSHVESPGSNLTIAAALLSFSKEIYPHCCSRPRGIKGEWNPDF